MNTMLKTLQFRAETTETLCPAHHIPMIEIAGHRLCKLCAKETVHHSNAAYADELQQRLLQQKIKNSGLNKRYLDPWLQELCSCMYCTRQCHQAMSGFCTADYF